MKQRIAESLGTFINENKTYGWTKDELALINKLIDGRAIDINNDPEEYEVSLFYSVHHKEFALSQQHTDKPWVLIFTEKETKPERIIRTTEMQRKDLRKAVLFYLDAIKKEHQNPDV